MLKSFIKFTIVLLFMTQSSFAENCVINIMKFTPQLYDYSVWSIQSILVSQINEGEMNAETCYEKSVNHIKNYIDEVKAPTHLFWASYQIGIYAGKVDRFSPEEFNEEFINQDKRYRNEGSYEPSVHLPIMGRSASISKFPKNQKVCVATLSYNDNFITRRVTIERDRLACHQSARKENFWTDSFATFKRENLDKYGISYDPSKLKMTAQLIDGTDYSAIAIMSEKGDFIVQLDALSSN